MQLCEKNNLSDQIYPHFENQFIYFSRGST